MFGTSSSTTVEVLLDITHDQDQSRFHRLARLLTSSSTSIIAGSTGITVAGTS
jgi:hypothetical protein